MNKKKSTIFFLCKFIYNIHKWDWIQCEFKSVFIKFLTKIFLLCKIYVQFLKNCRFFFSSIWFCTIIRIVITYKYFYPYLLIGELWSCKIVLILQYYFENINYIFDKFWFFGIFKKNCFPPFNLAKIGH
jgi:hypothetical protein